MPDTTPEGRPLQHGICACSMGCATTSDEPRAFNEKWCACWCHAPQYDKMEATGCTWHEAKYPNLYKEQHR